MLVDVAIDVRFYATVSTQCDVCFNCRILIDIWAKANVSHDWKKSLCNELEKATRKSVATKIAT